MGEIITRALINKDDKFLFCKKKGSNYWFLPGGHVEPGESAQEALAREIKEERGLIIEILGFVGVIENFFEQEGKEIYEVNLIFAAKETNEIKDSFSAEEHLEFKYIALNQFEKENILPVVVKNGVRMWLGEQKPFFLSNQNKNS